MMRTGIVLLLLCFLPVASFAAGEEGAVSGSSAEQVDGCGLVKAGEYKSAVDLLRKELAAVPDDPKLNLCLGIALNRLVDKAAVRPLKRVLLESPASPAVNFELGVHYYQVGVDAEAADYFDTVLQLAPQGNYAKAAENYLRSIEERSKEKPWNLELRLGLQSDSNVILNGEDQPVPEGYSGEDDMRVVAQARAGYTLFKDQTTDVSAAYTFYFSKHNELDDFDVMLHMVGLSASRQVAERVSLKASYDFEYLFLGGESYDTAHIVSPAMAIKFGKLGTSNLSYRYRTTSYINSQKFPDNTTRNGDNHLLALAHAVQISERIIAMAGFAYDSDVTDNDYWNYKGQKLQAGVRVALPWKLTADLNVERYSKTYQGDDPSFLRTREDDQTSYSLSLTRPFGKTWSVNLGQVHVVNSSNLAPYDYVRSMTSLFVIARY